MKCTTSCPSCGSAVETTVEAIANCDDVRCDDCYEKARQTTKTRSLYPYDDKIDF